MSSQTPSFPSRKVDGVLYRLAEPSDSDAIAGLMLSDFCTRMPLYRHVGATAPADVETSLAFVPLVVGQGQSIVAVDPDTQELLGVRLSGMEHRSDSPQQKHPLMVDTELMAKYPKESVVMRAIDILLTQADYFGKYPEVDSALAARFLAVRESHCGRRIGRRLMECAMELGRCLRAQLVVGATQSYYSQRIYEALEFERVHAMPIAEFVDPLTGERPFASMADTVHKEAVFFAKRI